MSNQAISAIKPAGQIDLSPQTFEQALTFSNYLAESDLVPKDYKGKPGNCLIAMQWGAEIGLKPMQALQGIAVINGRPALWGDALMALVRSSPVCEYITESDDGQVATCTVKRRGEPEQSRTFGVDDAKRAGLAGKQGPWTQYPARMRQMRARAFALRDVFPDVLKGLPVAEEVMDIPRDMGSAQEAQQAGAVASPDLIERAEAAAANGVLAFRAFWKGISGAERQQISKEVRDRCQAIATQADAVRTVDTSPVFPPVDEPAQQSQQPTGKSFSEVMQMLCEAATEEALFVAADWFEGFEGDSYQLLDGKFGERMAQIRGAA